MCGIVGGFSARGLDVNALRGATDCLRHRGPDAGNYYTDASDTVFLGHRRLSIIDLSETANQPMRSASGRYVMIFNGEVYNFNELRPRLPQQQWHTHSDTEVILELFAAFGPQSFSWLNGMFAIAIHDTQENKVYLARDPIGIKPLYIAESAAGVYWASELKALRKAGFGQSHSANRQAVAHFLHLGYVPEPMSIYEDIGKFPAGHWACWDVLTGRKEAHAFWKLEDHYLKGTPQPEDEAFKAYKDILYAAIERQLISDVPIGTFLSGGIDSSLVTAVASKVTRGKVSTFSIGFDDAAFDESKYANDVAGHLGTDHHLFRVGASDVLELIPSLINVYDEPFSDSSAFPTMLVSELARRHVTVTLSGDGGDELFQGYGMYTWADRLNRPAVRAFRKPLYLATRLMNQRAQRAGLVLNYPDRGRIPSHIFSQEQYYFGIGELAGLLKFTPPDFTSFNELPAGGLPQEQQAAWDITHYLKDNLLVKVDRASMKYSLESRVPLLDQQLVEFALGLPFSLKVREGFGTKYLMKKALYELVPRAMFDRPKRGFGAPIGRWLKSELAWMIDDYLDPKVLADAGFVNVPKALDIVRKFRGGTDYLYNRVWALIVLHKWWKDQQ